MPATLEAPALAPADLTADPSPPTSGKDGKRVRRWRVDGEIREFSLEPYPPATRPVYWYTGTGARLTVKSQEPNAHGIYPMILNDVFVDGSFSPRNEWENQAVREFLVRKHINPDKSRDERHPEGPGHFWRCMCGFRCPSYHVMDAHQRARGHVGVRSE